MTMTTSQSTGGAERGNIGSATETHEGQEIAKLDVAEIGQFRKLINLRCCHDRPTGARGKMS